jgi:hypothetical protein
VRRERVPKLFVSDAGNDEVLVLRVPPEQLVPDRAPDEIRVEAE